MALPRSTTCIRYAYTIDSNTLRFYGYFIVCIRRHRQHHQPAMDAGNEMALNFVRQNQMSMSMLRAQWVADGSPTHSNAVRIENPLQFVPAGTNPKEFKKLQQLVS